MYVGALNSTKDGQQVYAHVVNSIETNGVRDLTARLRQLVPSGFQVAERRTFRLANGDNPITPDIVVLGGENKVLAIDVKYSTPPFGPLDIRRDLEEMKKWKQQVSKYVTVFQQHSDIVAQHFSWPARARATVFWSDSLASAISDSSRFSGACLCSRLAVAWIIRRQDTDRVHFRLDELGSQST
jgi:hypothetical protein